MNIYEACPVLENESLIMRAVERADRDDLLKVYSDKNALPFFNSDNCDGDIFYYTTKQKMDEVLDFWQYAYQNKWFARLAIVSKDTAHVLGTVELCLRASEDEFNTRCILRVDVGSAYERSDFLYEVFTLVTPRANELLGGKGVITKAPAYAVERIAAISKAGFTKSDHLLVGKQGYAYDGYWELLR